MASKKTVSCRKTAYTAPMFRAVLALLLALLSITPALAQGQNRIAATLLAESDSPRSRHNGDARHPHGTRARPGTAIGRTRGGAGLPPEFGWTLPEGVTAGAVRYPVPHKLEAIGVMNHVFEGEHAWLVPLSMPATVKAGTTIPIALKLSYLACTDKLCLPQRADLSLTLTIGTNKTAPANRQFDNWARKAGPAAGDGRAVSVCGGNAARVYSPAPFCGDQRAMVLQRHPICAG